MIEVKEMTAVMPMEEYAGRFRDVGKFLARCRECPNFGVTWRCPPMPGDLVEAPSGYSRMLVVALVFDLGDQEIPASDFDGITLPRRREMERRLLAAEAAAKGRAFGFGGACRLCPEEECTRPAGKACRHPDRLRPSLEAYGFDVEKTMKELFGLNILWGKEGNLPQRVTLVAGMMFNAPEMNFFPL